MRQSTLEKKPTQCSRILKVLEDADGQWVNGRYFNNTMMISQYHSRIKELEMGGHDIKHSEDKDEFGFKSYRLLPKDQLKLI
jgi:hypothetical protein